MTRGQLPKAYLRIDPNIDQTHPDNLDGFIRLLCAANRQPRRGWFRSRAVLNSTFGQVATTRFYARGDVVDVEDGVQVPGWETWQEGDLDVGERVRRFRAKHALPAVTEPVTKPLPASEASRRQGVKASRHPSGVPDARATNGKVEGDPYDEAVRWLAERQAWFDSPKIATELARLVDKKGLPAVLAAMAAVPGAEEAAQFVYGAKNALYPLAGSSVTSKVDRERAEARAALGLDS